MGTMADVAKSARVSVTTVSHVLNDTRPVNPETRERVLKAIRDTNYQRNALATALATSRTKSIGVSISALRNPYFANLVHAIEARASARGYTLVMGDSHDDAAVEARLFESFLDRQLDGLIVAPAPGAETASLPMIVGHGTPLVLIDRHIKDVNCDQLAPENIEPARQLTRHLVELGHRRIAVISGIPGIQSTTERLEGCRQALQEAGLELDPSLIGHGNSSIDDAYAETLRIFGAGDSRPTGVVVLNNAMTIGTLRALKDLQLKVPGDVAFVCYDDFEWADLFEPSLTAIEQNVNAMGAKAVDLILDRIEGSDAPPQILRIPTVYHHRHSCGCTR
ncbi:LacI family DNA-binding transcriptional regulator [Arthrobacter sp. NPDC058127]|uniref:LacI family DNA-binding transcriptional regulator n=1 Tax=Arthrobacter sp. NPDC058127 TaxID=3346351 RepID=UPI0036F05D8B